MTLFWRSKHKKVKYQFLSTPSRPSALLRNNLGLNLQNLQNKTQIVVDSVRHLKDQGLGPDPDLTLSPEVPGLVLTNKFRR